MSIVIAAIVSASCGSTDVGSTETAVGAVTVEVEPSAAALADAAQHRATAMLDANGRGLWDRLTDKCRDGSTPGQVTDYLAFQRLRLREQTGVDVDAILVEVEDATVDGAIGRVTLRYTSGDQAADDVLHAEDRAASPWVWDGESWRHPDCSFRD